MIDAADIADMLQQVGKAFFQGFQIFFIQILNGNSAVVLQSPDAGHYHHRAGGQSGHTALDVKEFLRPQIRAEAGFCDAVVPQLQSHAGGGDGIAAVGDVGKGATVDNGGSMLQSLYQIGLQGVLQQSAHGAFRVEIAGSHRLLLRGFSVGIAHHQLCQPGFQVVDVVGQTEDGHDLRGGGNVISVLSGGSVALSAQTVHDIAELPVIHIHAPAPGDPPGIYVQGVALIDVVVHHSRQEVVGGADGVKISGKMKVDIFHRNHLGVSSPGGSALDAENRTQRRLTQGGHGFFADFPQAVRQPHGGGGLSLSRGSGIDSGYQHQFSVRGVGLF